MSSRSLRDSAAALFVIAAAAFAGDEKPRAAPHGTLQGEVLRAFAPAAARVEIRRVTTAETSTVDTDWYRRAAAERALFATLADGPPLRTLTVDATGEFATGDLELGTYEVRAIAADGAACVVAARATLPDELVRVTADLPGGPLTVKGRAVRRDGKPFRGLVAIDARDFELHQYGGSQVVSWPGAVETDADGKFELRGVADDLHRLVAVNPGAFLARGARFFGASAPSFVVDEGTREIAGVVTDGATGAAVPGAIVSCPAADDPAIAVAADAHGAFRLTVPDGAREIAVAAPGFLREIVGVPEKPQTAIHLVRGATVSGRVTAPDGAPVAGVRVRAVPTDVPREEGDRITRSGADGRFSFTAMERGSWAVFVLDDEWVSPEAVVQDPYADWNPLAVMVEPGDRLDLARPAVRCAHVRGVAVDDKARPVAGASVESWPADGSLWSGIVNRLPRVASRADGSFDLPLLPGRPMTVWSLIGKTSSALCGQRHTDQVEVPATGAGAAARGVRIMFAASDFLDVVVRDAAGHPVGGAAIRLHYESGCFGSEYGMFRTHADGHARCGPIVLGVIKVGAESDGLVGADVESNVDGKTPVDVTLTAGARIGGTIALPKDAPRGDVWVEVRRVEKSGEDTSMETIRAADDGMLRTSTLPRGRYRLAVRLTVPDGREWVGSASVESGDPPSKIELAPSGTARRTFELRIADGDGRPVERGTVRTAWREAGAWAFSQVRVESGTADVFAPAKADGVFVCVERASGADGLPGALGRTVVGPFSPSKPDAEIRLAVGLSISGVARRADGSPLPGLTVDATALDDPSGGAFAAPAAMTRTRDDGTFVLRGLAPGEYRLSSEAPGGLTSAAPVVKAGARDVEVVVGHGIGATVRVVDWNGEPVGSAGVVVRRIGNPDPVCANGTDAKGELRVDRLAEGTPYSLHVTPPRTRGDLGEWDDAAWMPSETEVTLPRRFVLQGAVVDGRGHGVEGVNVWARTAGGQPVGVLTRGGGSFRIERLESEDVEIAVVRSGEPRPDAYEKRTIGPSFGRLVYEPGPSIAIAVERTEEVTWNNAGTENEYRAQLVFGEDTSGPLVATQLVREGRTIVFDHLEAGSKYTLWIVADPSVRSWSLDGKSVYRKGLVAGATFVSVCPATGRSIEGRLTSPGRALPESVRVRVRNGAVECVAEVKGDRYVARGLFEGLWTIEAECESDGRKLQATQAVEAGGTADLELRVR